MHGFKVGWRHQHLSGFRRFVVYPMPPSSHANVPPRSGLCSPQRNAQLTGQGAVGHPAGFGLAHASMRSPAVPSQTRKARGVTAPAARGVPTPGGRGGWSPATVLHLDRAAPAREAA